MNAKRGGSGSDRECLAAAAQGDQAAFATLYDRHIRPVYLSALKILGTEQDAEDVSQDVFVLAWVKRSDIRIVDVSILPWLLVSTRHLCMNRVRARRHEAGEDIDLAETFDPRRGPAELAELAQIRTAIASSVATLSESDQAVYKLCLVNDMSYQEAADALGASHGAVRNRLTRLKRVLRGNLVTQNEGLS